MNAISVEYAERWTSGAGLVKLVEADDAISGLIPIDRLS